MADEEIWEIKGHKCGHAASIVIPLKEGDLYGLKSLADKSGVVIDKMPKKGASEFTFRIKGPHGKISNFNLNLPMNKFVILSNRVD